MSLQALPQGPRMINSKEVNSVGVFSKVPMQDTDTVLSMIISRKGQFSLVPVIHTFQRHKLLRDEKYS